MAAHIRQYAEAIHETQSTLYITPLRSLNRDLLKRIMWWSKELDFDVSVRHGDTTQYERSMQAQNPPDLMISTPETLQAVLTGKIMRSHLANIQFIVIDEVHELVASKRGVQLAAGLERLKKMIRKNLGKEPQIVCLSATVGNPKAVAGYFMDQPHIVNTERGSMVSLFVEAPTAYKKDESRIPPEVRARLDYIISEIEKRNSLLIFTNTREAAERISSKIKSMRPDLSVQTHHSSLSKELRLAAEDDFKAGKIKALICTSSLELGIDIGQVDFIIQYNSPRQVSKMLQRVGRAGHRLDKTSEGVIITTGMDDAFESAVIAKLAMEGKIEPSRLYGKSLDVLAQQVVGMSMETWKTPLKDIKDTLRTSRPFASLTEKEVIDTAMVMQRAGYGWLNYIKDGKETIKT
ncbi:MAG: helicase-related protein, partial [Candidatus Aenigmatarchaeota archaeon]